MPALALGAVTVLLGIGAEPFFALSLRAAEQLLNPGRLCQCRPRTVSESMLVLNIFLALAWVALTGGLSAENFFAGFVVGYAVIWIARDAIGAQGYVTKVPRVLRFGLYFLGLFARASLAHHGGDHHAAEDDAARDHRGARSTRRPTRRSSSFRASITLTPGGLALDVSSDRQYIYVHEMYVTDPEHARAELKNGLEKRLLEVLR